MKSILKFIGGIIGFCYLLVILFVTACLLCYNQYKVTQFGDYSLILIDSKSERYTDGDLVVFLKNANDDIESGDEIFFYEVTNTQININVGEVTNTRKITDTETTFTINESLDISSETVIGKTETATVFHTLGKILYVLESRFGFLLLIILPTLLLFFYEVYELIVEIKTPYSEQ